MRDGDRAIAARERTLSKGQEREELRCEWERSELLRSLKQTAEDVGHEVRVWVRSDQESLTSCARCGARIYVRVSAPARDGRRGARRAVPGGVARTYARGRVGCGAAL